MHVCLQPGCPEPVDVRCWCLEHLHHCDDLECEHNAHRCEDPIHYCDTHREMSVEELDEELTNRQRFSRRIMEQIAEFRAEKQQLADAGELSEAHAELIDAEIESLRLRSNDVPEDDDPSDL